MDLISAIGMSSQWRPKSLFNSTVAYSTFEGFCAESEKKKKAVRIEKAVSLQYKHAVEKHQEVKVLHRWVGTIMKTLVRTYLEVGVPRKNVPEKLACRLENLFSENAESSSAECLVQVLFYFELLCYLGDESDISPVIEKITVRLRRLSLYKNPSVAAEFVQELTPYYIGRVRNCLREVFERMMYSLPPELRPVSSPSCSLAIPDLRAVDVNSSSAEEKSLGAEDDARGEVKRKLARHRSFQGVLSRQIMVPQKKKKKKKVQKASHRSKTSGNMRKSPSILSRLRKREDNKGIHQLKKSACRKLFSRSHTMSEIGGQKLSGEDATTTGSLNSAVGKEIKDMVLVEETPLKKKKKQESCQEVMVVEESPRRSFYSARKWTPSTPQFKTPPMSNAVHCSSRLSPNVVLNTQPSSSTIHSLLHDKFTPPHSCS